ncbi:histone deacetylase 6 isoform X1 [Lacerta agilis]|uniref:histone deacetylase 6 isoform X1 n=1 Tax=Lacerta agilis TaxID=80427 RepID=UPI00141A04D7|nr:histone deacetylase 6 isoform X1 [Lacerta agilis]
MASDVGDAQILEPSSVSPLETRAPTRKTKKKGGLPDAKRKGRAKRLNKDAEDLLSSMQRLDLTTECAAPVGTGLVWDERMTQFRCTWDESFPECPERLVAIRDKLLQCGLLERCIPVEAQEISEEEILLAHSPEYLALMKSTETMSEAELRSLSDTYDSVYLHPNSYRCACLAAGSVLQLVEKVLAGKLRNGLALVRPPGHHAQHDKMDGYCMFNNVGIAAQYARQKLGVERVLIVDWDVHHGQGTQYLFEDNPSILYFSIHRYEGGSFWPHLLDSDSHAVGRGRGEGYNINLPWNQIGMRDADYLSAFLHILLPVALEFQPQLVLVAAGFDSVIGDPKGEMSATPACFAHLTHLLMPLSGGKLVLSLEGGYNLQSLAEGTCAVLKALLGDPCPLLESPLTPCTSALCSISQTLAVHSKYWKNLRRTSTDVPRENGGEAGIVLPPPLPAAEILSKSAAELMLPRPPSCTGLVYDEKMTEHYNMWDSQHPELPQRVSRIFQRHGELRLTERCCRLPARLASEEELRMCHSLAYVETVKSTAAMKPRDLHRQGDQYNSIFICASSYECARLAAGSAFSAVEAVLSGQVQNAVAIVRPPGHHAESDTACGFCFFNSVALAARYAQRLAGRPMRVMILDWDVHHGNGTQHMFEDDPSVLYVSLHRYDNGTFFPTSEDADYDRVGLGPGEGFTLNVPWNCPRMGDPEYLAAFHQIVMPVSYEFNPELVLVSAGFDAARGDPLGGCLVTPECYAHMTHLLLGLAGGKVVVVLEGGYNLESISESMTMCTRSLLGDPLPPLGRLKAPHPSALQSLANAATVHRKYWASLRLEVPAPLWEKPRTRAGKGTPIPDKIPPEAPQELLQSPSTQPVNTLNDAILALSSLQLEDRLAEEAETASSSLSPDSSPVGEEAGHKVGASPGEAEPAVDTQKESMSTGSSTGGAESPGKEAEVSPPAVPPMQVEVVLLDEAAGGCSSSCEPLEEDLVDEGLFYAVTPLQWCPHLDSVLPVPSVGLNVLEPCAECGSVAENWVCLICYKVCCGRYIKQHMVAHNSESGHPLVLSFADLSVWCYGCQAYVHHPILFEAKRQAHLLKFGVDVAVPS